MNEKQSPYIRTLPLLIAMALTVGIYSYTIFSNFCIDLDTMNWAVDLNPLKNEMTFLNSIAIKGWFTKFHLFMFAFVYLITKLYSFFAEWDYLMGFKICTLICAVLTMPLLFFICKNTMRNLLVMLVISIVPLYTLGYSWLITTCDDNPLANFFNLVFVTVLLIATGAIRGELRERHCLRWAFLTGIAVGFSMASHLKNIVALPIILALIAVKPPRPTKRFSVGAAGFLGLILSFGLMYLLYWVQSTGEPTSSKLDFWVFHRVSGRFFLTPPHPALRDHLVFVLAGIRSSLYAFQELVIHTDIYDSDILGPLVIAAFFILYLVSACAMRANRAVKILLALFVCDAGHSFLYDSWVVERWDSFTLPVFLTIGIFWDSMLRGEEGRVRPAGVRLSAFLLIFFSVLVGSNIRSTRLLIGITNNSIPYRPSTRPWPYYNKIFFYFDHRGIYDLAKRADGYFTEGTYFLSPLLMQHQSHVFGLLDQYLKLYSKQYPSHLITDPALIGSLVGQGKMKRLLYIDSAEFGFYTGKTRSVLTFDPSITKTVYRNSQLVLNEVGFRAPALH